MCIAAKLLHIKSWVSIKICDIVIVVTSQLLYNRTTSVVDHARRITKLQLRQPTLDRLLNSRQEDIEHFVNFIKKESIQKSLGMYLEALKNRLNTK